MDKDNFVMKADVYFGLQDNERLRQSIREIEANDPTELAAALLMPFADLIAAAQAVLKYAEETAPKPIESAPLSGQFYAWCTGRKDWMRVSRHHMALPDGCTHWLPIPAPPTQAPAVFTDLAAAVEGVG